MRRGAGVVQERPRPVCVFLIPVVRDEELQCTDRV